MHQQRNENERNRDFKPNSVSPARTHYALHVNDGHSYNASVKVAKSTERKAMENGDEHAAAGTGSQPNVFKSRSGAITGSRWAQGCDRVFCHLDAVSLLTFILPHILNL
jgi:hypothetical protein